MKRSWLDVIRNGFDLAPLASAAAAIGVIAVLIGGLTAALVPAIKSGKKIIIAAHGNSIRALVKYLDNISEADITELNIPTGLPLVYELDADLKPIKSYYLGDPEEAAKKAAEVANQAKTK